MKVEELHKSLTALYVEWGSVLDRIEHCKESFEDFLPHSLEEYVTATNMCRFILSAIQKKIPIKCSCGSFEFKQETIISPTSQRRNNKEPYEYSNHRLRYTCIQCGKELQK